MGRRVSLVALATVCLFPAAAPARTFEVQVARSAYGIPHISAKDYAGIGYGYARALAQDTVCTVAEAYVTSSAQRSRFFGPDKGYAIRGNGSTANNLNSDVFYQRIIDRKTIEKLLEVKPPMGPKPEIVDGVRGYVAGWNAWLKEVGGRDRIPDPTCRGKEWVRPITEMDVWRRFYSLALLASTGVAIDGIASARPLSPVPAVDPRMLAPGIIDERLGGLGSNAYGLGKDATASGHGIVYGNPHFPWQGPERFYQAHLTIPGKVDVMGASLLGVPLVNIGFTKGVAWSHTVSTARRFVPFELRLVPGSPTTYLVDGQPREMTKEKVTVQVLGADGKVSPVSRTLYSSHHGPLLTGILGLPIFPWTPERAYAMYDVNAENFGRLFNHFFDVNSAQSVGDVEAILRKYQGIPWVNTIAADTSGTALYADVGAIPNVPAAKQSACQTALGIALDQLQRVIVLDGSRGECEPATDPDAAAPGILGFSKEPLLKRTDHVSNMNDSHWLTNPAQPLEGFPRIIGDERAARSLRTRVGIRIILDRLAGKDGLPGNRFDLDNLRELAMGNRVFAGEVWRDDLVAFCQQTPIVATQAGPVDVSGACPVLEAWNLREDLDSRGALLFRRFVSRVTGVAPLPLPYPLGPFAQPFDAADPVETPRGLMTLNPTVGDALGQAVNDLTNAGLKLDAPLREGAAVTRRDERIPIQGGPGGSGIFNVITPVWDARKGFTEVVHGSSYVQAVELRPGCPKAYTILTYGLSTNPTSVHTSDQTKLFSEKKWVEPPFCPKAVASLLRTHTVERTNAKVLGTVALREARGAKRARLTVQLARRATLTVTVRRGKRVVRRIVRRNAAAGERRVALRVRRGAYRVTVTARVGRRAAESVRLSARQK